jgi:AcrR family transcriptional regulator
MARKCKEDAARTYQLLLDAAEQVFSQKGYATATFQEIADHAGLTRGAIYWHFNDKPQLLEAVLMRARLPWDNLPEQFDSLEQSPSLSDLGQTIGRAMDKIIGDASLRRITAILLLRTELVGVNHHVYSRLTSINERIVRYLVAALSWRYRTVEGSPHPAIPAAAHAVKALLTGLVYEALLTQTAIDQVLIPRTVEQLITSLVSNDTPGMY